MPRDRLLELREKGGISDFHIAKPKKASPKKNSKKNDQSEEALLNQEQDFELFLEKCTNIRNELTSLNDNFVEITKLHGALLSTPGADAENSKNLNTRVDAFITKATQIRESLKDLSEDTKPSSGNSCGISRAKNEQVRAIYKTFETLMLKFNKEQEEYKDKAKNKIVEYLKIKNMQLSDEEIEDAVSSGNLSELTKGVMLALNEKKALYNDVQSRAKELKMLENQMAELSQMFHDIHILVVNQGEMMDRIENSVQNATEYAGKALKNVTEARRFKKKTDKMKVVILICSIVVVLILLLFLQAAVCHFTPIC